MVKKQPVEKNMIFSVQWKIHLFIIADRIVASLYKNKRAQIYMFLSLTTLSILLLCRHKCLVNQS